MDHPMPSAPRTITLPTVDHGTVVLPEPTWCAGHTDHHPDTNRADILHTGPDTPLTFHGRTLSTACLTQAPHASRDRDVRISVSMYGAELDPTGVYELAAALDAYADRLRDLADQLAALLAGGAR
ncbi:DUF6907 domain-containing protein [Streptomyces sp. NPDC048566]|uniref:DUF6907 domain-containing protein n=1 Tax=Streptomyces sp. NPDC048566 TaxID=3365569 RepID=UPI003718A611